MQNINYGLFNNFCKNGLFGMEKIYVKNDNYIWQFINLEDKLYAKCSKDNGNTWYLDTPISEDFKGLFSFAVSQNDILHIAFQNLSGRINYIIWKQEQIIKEELMDSFSSNENLVFQTLLIDENSDVYLVYFTENYINQSWTIKYTFKKEKDGWEESQIIDSGEGTIENSGAAMIEKSGGIHIIYQMSENQTNRLIHRYKEKSEVKWSEKNIITNSVKTYISPSIVIDDIGVVHLAYIRSSDTNYTIYYKQKSKGGWMVGGWNGEIAVSSKISNGYNPALFISKDNISVLWQQVDGIYKSSSIDYGKTFSKPLCINDSRVLNLKSIIPICLYKKQSINSAISFDSRSFKLAILFLLNNVKLEGYLNDELSSPFEKDMGALNQKIQKYYIENTDIIISNKLMQDTIEEYQKRIKQLEEYLDESKKVTKKLEDKFRLFEKSNKSLYEKYNDAIKNLENEKRSFLNKESIFENTEKNLNDDITNLKNLLENPKKKSNLSKIVNKLLYRD